MNAEFGWAHFGDAGGGHKLIDAIGIHDEKLSAIRWHTDLPPDAPAQWTSFYSGYQMGDEYVLQFTEPDLDADRPGMVKTTLASAPIDELSGLDLDRLRRYATSGADSVPPQERVADRVEGLSGVLDLLSESGPVYWIGRVTFDALIDQLWEVLNAEDRSALVFGQLFNPTSVPYPQTTGTLGIYLVPAQLRARFDPTRTIDSADPPQAGETSSAILGADMTLSTELGIESPSLREWRHLARAGHLLDRVNSADPDGLRACAHLVAHLAPGPDRGVAIKASIARMMVESAPHAAFSHVRGLRTLDLADLRLDVDSIVEPWVVSVLGPPGRIDDLHTASMELAAAPEDPICLSIDRALDRAIASSGEAIADNLAEALRADRREVFAELASRVSPQIVDSRLAAVKGIGEREWVHEIAAEAQLPLTHGESCPSEHPTEAFRVHLRIPGQSPLSRSRLATRCESRGVVKAALALEAHDLLELAIDAVDRDADALLPAEPKSTAWMAIWGGAVASGADPWKWLDPVDAVAPILDALLDGHEYAMTLASELGKIEGIHISSYSRRAEIWPIIKDPTRTHLLRRTASSLAFDDAVTPALEPALRAAVVDPDTMKAIAAVDVSKAVQALDALQSFASSSSAEAIAASANLGTEAHHLGELIRQNRWKGAARYIVANVERRADLVEAERTCQHLLNRFDYWELKYFRSGRSAPVAELSAGVHEVLARLFPNGPEDSNIWARAGGEVADLELAGTGRQRWNFALEAIMRGAAGAPTLARLIEEMLRDFPINHQLENIRRAL